MIFTRRFGALAARPTFPHVEEPSLEEELELMIGDVRRGRDHEDALVTVRAGQDQQ